MTVRALCQHFLYGLFDGVGYRLLKTPLVDQLLTRDEFQWLLHIGDFEREEKVLSTDLYITPLFQKLKTYSLIKPQQDMYGRVGRWNHTILLTYQDYLAINQSNHHIEQYLQSFFIREPIPIAEFQPLHMEIPT